MERKEPSSMLRYFMSLLGEKHERSLYSPALFAVLLLDFHRSCCSRCILLSIVTLRQRCRSCCWCLLLLSLQLLRNDLRHLSSSHRLGLLYLLRLELLCHLCIHCAHLLKKEEQKKKKILNHENAFLKLTCSYKRTHLHAGWHRSDPPCCNGRQLRRSSANRSRGCRRRRCGCCSCTRVLALIGLARRGRDDGVEVLLDCRNDVRLATVCDLFMLRLRPLRTPQLHQLQRTMGRRVDLQLGLVPTPRIPSIFQGVVPINNIY